MIRGSLREGRLALSVAQEGHVGLLGQGVRERGGDVRDETRGERGALEERLAAGGEARGRLGGLRCRLHDDGGAAGLRGDLGGARGDGRADARGGGEGEGHRDARVDRTDESSDDASRWRRESTGLRERGGRRACVSTFVGARVRVRSGSRDARILTRTPAHFATSSPDKLPAGPTARERRAMRQPAKLLPRVSSRGRTGGRALAAAGERAG